MNQPSVKFPRLRSRSSLPSSIPTFLIETSNDIMLSDGSAAVFEVCLRCLLSLQRLGTDPWAWIATKDGKRLSEWCRLVPVCRTFAADVR
jgi:hypothetical protein